MSGNKWDDGKLQYHLVPRDSLAELVRVYMHGADKYGVGNWLKGFKWSRVWNAAQRHLQAWADGEDVDPESGLNHLAHVAWNVFTLFAMQARGLGEDDRDPWGCGGGGGGNDFNGVCVCCAGLCGRTTRTPYESD